MKRNTLVFLLLTLFLIIVIYLVANLSQGNTTFFGKASMGGVFSVTNSYVFGSPLTARVGGDKIRITIFALDDQRRGVSRKNVVLSCKDVVACQNAGLSFTDIQPNTDTLGQAIYDLSANAAGKYELQASIDGVVIPQTVTVLFR